MKRIYVLQARWVLIGTVKKAPAGFVALTDASVIRVWGTTLGLGQIATQGPTKETKLDPCGQVEFPISSVLFSIDCTYAERAN